MRSTKVAEARAKASSIYGQLHGPCGLLPAIWKRLAHAHPEPNGTISFSVANGGEKVTSPDFPSRRNSRYSRRNAMAAFYHWSYDSTCLYKTAMETPDSDPLAIINAAEKLESLKAAVETTPLERMHEVETGDWLVKVAVENGLAHTQVRKLVNFGAILLPPDYDLYAVPSKPVGNYDIYLASTTDNSYAYVVGQFTKSSFSFASRRQAEEAIGGQKIPSQIVSIGYDETTSLSKDSGTYYLTGIDYRLSIPSSFFRKANGGVLAHFESLLYSCGVDFGEFWEDSSLQISSGIGGNPASAIFSLFSTRGERQFPILDIRLFFTSGGSEKAAQVQIASPGSMRIKLHNGNVYNVASYSLVQNAK